MRPDGTPAPTNDNNPAPAPAAPADNTPAPGGETPPAPAAPAAPEQPRTIDPVDHSKPADPVAPAADDPTPPADPANPDGEGEQPNDEDPTIADVVATPEEDDTTKALNERQQQGKDLPSGVNPDGTIDPLVYAYENLPIIKISGKIGNGKVETIEVRTGDDMPDGFRFVDAKEQTRALAAIQQNINIAKDYINDAQAYNAQRSETLQRQQVAVQQKTEIEKLQESGKLPKFSKQPGEKGFMETPEAQRAQQVLDFMKEKNAEFKASGINQEITSVEMALMLLEAKEATDARDGRVSGIQQARNNVNNSISGGGTTPAVPSGDGQRIHRSTAAAVEAGLRKAGKL